MFKADRSGSRRISRPSISGPRTDKWEIPAGHVIVEEWLGEGCFGEVRKGVVKGPIPNSQYMKTSICVTVAIKLLKCKTFLKYISSTRVVVFFSIPHDRSMQSNYFASHYLIHIHHTCWQLHTHSGQPHTRGVFRVSL